jgi:hypothetical protein
MASSVCASTVSLRLIASQVIEEGPDKPELKGTVRILRVFLDTNQYARDMQACRLIEMRQSSRAVPSRCPVTGALWLRSKMGMRQWYVGLQAVANGLPDVYEGFNILLRRKAKENNFKAVLETIRYAGGQSEYLQCTFVGGHWRKTRLTLAALLPLAQVPDEHQRGRP